MLWLLQANWVKSSILIEAISSGNVTKSEASCVWPYLLKKSLTVNFNFYPVSVIFLKENNNYSKI